MGIFDHSSRSAFVRSGSDGTKTPNFTLGTMQSGKYRSPSNRQTQTRPSNCQTEKRDSLDSSGGVLYTTASDALHCTW